MTESKHGWYSPTLALRHGYAIWTDSEERPVKCCAVTDVDTNPFPDSVIDVRYVGKVHGFTSKRYGMLPPLITINPLTWEKDFSLEYYLGKFSVLKDESHDITTPMIVWVVSYTQ